MQQHSTPHPAPDEPLTLAVHALPDVVNPDFVDAAPSGRGKLLAIVFACLLPLLLLYLIFFVVRPMEQRDFGTAIEPARPLPAALASANGQWQLIGAGPSRCEDRCAKHLFIQRQLREMLAKKQLRIDRQWLLLDDGPVPEQLKPLLQDAQQRRVTPAQASEIFGVDSGQATSRLFVADPQGRLVLSMPADEDSAQVRAAMWTLQQLIARGNTMATER